MYYEINVSLKGQHFFATADRSLTLLSDVHKVMRVFKVKFPESEGFEISVSRYQLTGEVMNIAAFQPRVTGWFLMVHLSDETAYVHNCSQEWDNVLIDAREIFDTVFRGVMDEPLKAVKIDVYAEMSDGENVHRFTWNNKEEVQ